ncbi:MAG: acyloxyacyl hydrolase [Bacteroidetes bacterium]|nr:MAG: acyloxyacyl hydrolase [Bacteroidota bacterium]
MKHWIFFFTAVLYSALPHQSSSQEDYKGNWLLRGDFHFGATIPEYQLSNQYVDNFIYSGEISFQKQLYGRSFWEQLYKYPVVGVTAAYSSLGNRDIFGHEIALYGFFQTHLINKSKFQLNSQFGLGLGWATKHFDVNENYLNVAVGSGLNIHFNYKMGASYFLTERTGINLGLSFSHFSNANMAEPNLGINTFTLYTGVNRFLKPPKAVTSHEIEKHKDKNEFAFIYAAGGKHTRALQSTIYFTSSVSAEYKRHLSYKFRIGGGLDLFYDSSTKTEMSLPGKPTYHPENDFRTGIHFSQEIAFDKFSFILQEGHYFLLTNKVDNRQFYNRGIVRYKINDHLLVHISMKSHLHILDYPEFGMGYYF